MFSGLFLMVMFPLSCNGENRDNRGMAKLFSYIRYRVGALGELHVNGKVLDGLSRLVGEFFFKKTLFKFESLFKIGIMRAICELFYG